MKHLLNSCVILISLLSGCVHEHEGMEDCVESQLVKNEMTAYNGQDLGCKFFLTLYQYDNEQYFLLGNHCADMITFPTDCNGKQLDNNDFSQKALLVKIVGIRE